MTFAWARCAQVVWLFFCIAVLQLWFCSCLFSKEWWVTSTLRYIRCVRTRILYPCCKGDRAFKAKKPKSQPKYTISKLLKSAFHGRHTKALDITMWHDLLLPTIYHQWLFNSCYLVFRDLLYRSKESRIGQAERGVFVCSGSWFWVTVFVYTWCIITWVDWVFIISPLFGVCHVFRFVLSWSVESVHGWGVWNFYVFGFVKGSPFFLLI